MFDRMHLRSRPFHCLFTFHSDIIPCCMVHTTVSCIAFSFVTMHLVLVQDDVHLYFSFIHAWLFRQIYPSFSPGQLNADQFSWFNMVTDALDGNGNRLFFVQESRRTGNVLQFTSHDLCQSSVKPPSSIKTIDSFDKVLDIISRYFLLPVYGERPPACNFQFIGPDQGLN